ncbi:MAG: aroE [Gammaproteobacteria bacterium]|jgi:shikimate dehydrogenase|nr:aroE [Gammaproteobacteria bacterium]
MKLAVIGNPISHSKSPFIHQEFAKEAGWEISYEKVLASKETGGFAACINELKAKGFEGCNVTLPFKEEAYALADSCSDRAGRARAANTLKFNQDGSIFADNTDGIGLIRDIQNNIGYSLNNKRILICGAGGAVRGILFPILEQCPASLVVANRTYDKALNLAKEFSEVMSIEASTYSDLAYREFDVIIEGTSALKEALSLPESLRLSPNSLYYDLKYKEIKNHGATYAHNGIGMLVEQAAESFKLWTGFMPQTQNVIAKFIKSLMQA